MAYETPEPRNISSTSALLRKYSSGESSDGFVMLICTIRSTPARRAASNKTRELRIASANVNLG